MKKIDVNNFDLNKYKDIILSLGFSQTIMYLPFNQPDLFDSLDKEMYFFEDLPNDMWEDAARRLDLLLFSKGYGKYSILEKICILKTAARMLAVENDGRKYFC